MQANRMQAAHMQATRMQATRMQTARMQAEVKINQGKSKWSTPWQPLDIMGAAPWQMDVTKRSSPLSWCGESTCAGQVVLAVRG